MATSSWQLKRRGRWRPGVQSCRAAGDAGEALAAENMVDPPEAHGGRGIPHRRQCQLLNGTWFPPLAVSVRRDSTPQENCAIHNTLGLRCPGWKEAWKKETQGSEGAGTEVRRGRYGYPEYTARVEGWVVFVLSRNDNNSAASQKRQSSTPLALSLIFIALFKY